MVVALTIVIAATAVGMVVKLFGPKVSSAGGHRNDDPNFSHSGR
jgi:hypothetical protein